MPVLLATTSLSSRNSCLKASPIALLDNGSAKIRLRHLQQTNDSSNFSKTGRRREFALHRNHPLLKDHPRPRKSRLANPNIRRTSMKNQITEPLSHPTNIQTSSSNSRYHASSTQVPRNPMTNFFHPNQKDPTPLSPSLYQSSKSPVLSTLPYQPPPSSHHPTQATPPKTPPSLPLPSLPHPILFYSIPAQKNPSKPPSP